jgi:hypothetical protein
MRDHTMFVGVGLRHAAIRIHRIRALERDPTVDRLTLGSGGRNATRGPIAKVGLPSGNRTWSCRR